MKKRFFLSFIGLAAFSCLFAQTFKSPFSQYGYKKQVMYTSSKGEFEEFHGMEDVVEVGSVFFNTKTNSVVGYINKTDIAEVASATSAMSVDPLCEKYYWISPYAYCMNNPVNAIDPDGRSTWVMNNSDGTYRVIGGDLYDKDKNIYSYSMKDGDLVRGNSIGVTTSITSFYNSDKDNGKGNEKGGWVVGSIINPNDKSGDAFLGNMFGSTPAMFDDYMANGGNGGKYDFKATNGTDNVMYSTERGQYRGMPIGENAKGQTIYSSARDIGNMAAGFVAGANGMSWEASRIAFDAYQSKKSGYPAIEGASTRNAEYYGWRLGSSNLSPSAKAQQLGRSVSSGLERLWNFFSN
jgi:hypothetical protein